MTLRIGAVVVRDVAAGVIRFSQAVAINRNPTIERSLSKWRMSFRHLSS